MIVESSEIKLLWLWSIFRHCVAVFTRKIEQVLPRELLLTRHTALSVYRAKYQELDESGHQFTTTIYAFTNTWQSVFYLSVFKFIHCVMYVWVAISYADANNQQEFCMTIAKLYDVAVSCNSSDRKSSCKLSRTGAWICLVMSRHIH